MAKSVCNPTVAKPQSQATKAPASPGYKQQTANSNGGKKGK